MKIFLKINSDTIFVAKEYSGRESTTHFFDKEHILKPACFEFAPASLQKIKIYFYMKIS